MSCVSLSPLDQISNLDFIFRHLLANVPCILCSNFSAHWRALRQWVDRKTGRPNFEFLKSKFGTESVPILIGTDICPTQMPFSSFIDEYFGFSPTDNETKNKVAYLKDWHFQNSHPEESDLYELPAFLRFDWANYERWTVTDQQQNPFGGDYRFVYFGTKGSWTPFHSDVLNSFSWSANVCGRKLWYLLRPGAERRVRQANGAYPEDIRQCLGQFQHDELFQFVQEPAQIVFVPSGWWHQVHNLEESISINHNVINAFNLHHLVPLLEYRLTEVRAEISDVRELMTEDEFEKQCELLLLSDLKMNRTKLLRLMELIIESRGNKVEKEDEKHLLWTKELPNFYDDPSAENEIAKWAEKMQTELSKECKCEQQQNFLCQSCAEFVRHFELIRASEMCKRLLKDPFLNTICL